MQAKKYSIRIEEEADTHLLEHVDILSDFSINASNKLIDSFEEHIAIIAANPFLYQFADDRDSPGIPEKEYRRCVIMKRYKIMYRIDDEMIIVEAVLDARSENKDIVWSVPVKP